VKSWFQSLLSHSTCTAAARGPELTASNCIPILISSDFLQMERLVEECLAHICTHILDVVGDVQLLNSVDP
jgi:hypothetical protein